MSADLKGPARAGRTGSAGVSPASSARSSYGWHTRGYLPHFDRPGLRQLAAAVAYIHDNPVKAGLAQTAQDWPYSSAAVRAPTNGAGETPALPGLASRFVDVIL